MLLNVPKAHMQDFFSLLNFNMFSFQHSSTIAEGWAGKVWSYADAWSRSSMKGNSWSFTSLPWLLPNVCDGKKSISPSCAVSHALLIRSVPAVQGIQQLKQTHITPYISQGVSLRWVAPLWKQQTFPEKSHPLSHQPTCYGSERFCR